MNSDVQDIIELYQHIISNLDLEPQQDITINQLFTEKNYCIIFRIMFPFLENEIDNIQKERNPTGEKLQGLIEFLSYPVLTMDLSHISGHSIAQGDLRHLYNFLQILLELSKLYKDQAQNSTIEKSDSDGQPPFQQQFSPEQSGGHNDFSEPEMRDDEYEESLQNEDDDENKKTKKIERQKSHKELKYDPKSTQQEKKQSHPRSDPNQGKSSSKNQDSQKKKNDQIPNSKENQMKALEQNILPIPQQQQRILTKDPNLPDKLQKKNKDPKKKGKPQQVPRPQSSRKEQPEEEYDEELPNLSELDQDFLEQHDEEEVMQLDEDDPIRVKYSREKQKEEILNIIAEKIKEGQYSGEEPGIDEFIDFQIKVIKESLKKMKMKPTNDDSQTIQQILKNRDKYKRFLKDYLKTYQQKQQKKDQKAVRSQQSSKQQEIMNQKKKDDLKKEFENEHLSMYYKLRDEKLNYLRKIHRIIFELEKRKIIDEKKDHLQTRRQQNIITRNALTSIENAYNDKISMLKEKLQNERKERHIAGVAQKSILSKLEKELRDEKMKQIQELKDVWRQEKERFDYLMKDDGELEKRILQIYKKY